MDVAGSGWADITNDVWGVVLVCPLINYYWGYDRGSSPTAPRRGHKVLRGLVKRSGKMEILRCSGLYLKSFRVKFSVLSTVLRKFQIYLAFGDRLIFI